MDKGWLFALLKLKEAAMQLSHDFVYNYIVGIWIPTKNMMLEYQFQQSLNSSIYKVFCKA